MYLLLAWIFLPALYVRQRRRRKTNQRSGTFFLFAQPTCYVYIKLVKGASAWGVCIIFAIIYKRQHFCPWQADATDPLKFQQQIKHSCYLTDVNSNNLVSIIATREVNMIYRSRALWQNIRQSMWQQLTDIDFVSDKILNSLHLKCHVKAFQKCISNLKPTASKIHIHKLSRPEKLRQVGSFVLQTQSAVSTTLKRLR